MCCLPLNPFVQIVLPFLAKIEDVPSTTAILYAKTYLYISEEKGRKNGEKGNKWEELEGA